MKYLIIGNGTAGIDAALNIRKNDENGQIDVITKSKYNMYFRPKLIEYVSEDIEIEKMVIYKDDFYKKNRINLHLNNTVQELIRDQKQVTLLNGEIFEYDKLLFATGSYCFVPPIQGNNLNGVFTVKTIEDCDKIKKFSKDKKNLVVIGGGLLGLEIAYSLKKLYEEVTVVEYNSYLLGKQLDKKGAKFLEKLLKEKGLNFKLDSEIKEIIGDGRVEKVILGSNEEINADAVIISAGVRSNLGIAKDAGISVNRGIVINDNMQTNDPNIFAAGDCCEYNGNIYGLWLTAKEQGKYAGENMAGKKTNYKGSMPTTQLKITGIDLFSAGKFDTDEYESEICDNDDCYRKIVHEHGTAKGAIVIGDKKAIMIARKILSGRGNIQEFIALFDNN